MTRSATLVVENNESIRRNPRSGLDSASYAPTDSELADALGGNFEYFSLWRLPLWPFTWFRLFKKEEE